MKSKKRQEQINKICEDLESLKVNSGEDTRYATLQNLNFFKAARHWTSYLHWLFISFHQIDGTRLLELADFAIDKWDLELHRRLVAVSKQRFPGMVEPLKRALFKYITSYKPKIVMDLGAGGMEVERQLIEELRNKNYSEKIIFIGIDRSGPALEVMQENFRGLNATVDILIREELTANELESLKTQTRSKHLIIFCKNNIFTLDNTFGPGIIDAVFHTRFKHHLTNSQRVALDTIVTALAKNVFEFDEFKTFPVMLVQSLFTWKYPVLMNGAILSRLREKLKTEVELENKGVYSSLEYYGLLAAYLKTYKR